MKAKNHNKFVVHRRSIMCLKQRCKSPWRQFAVATKFLMCRLKFTGPQFETVFMSPFWRLWFWGGC